MKSRRTPDDAGEMERVESSPEFEAGDVVAVERYYQLLYLPFFNDRDIALGTQYRLTENRTRNRDTAKRIFAELRRARIAHEARQHRVSGLGRPWRA